MKSEKGYTGIDIAISVIVLFIFVSVIAILFYNFNSSSKEIELKSEATAIAVETIEEMKNLNFEDIEDRSEANGNSQYIPEDINQETEEVKTGFFQKVIIQDYADLDSTKVPGLVKKITVQVQYMFKGEMQTVELSTVASKES